MSEKKFRKCYVLREIEVPMEDLKKDDIFRLDRASPDDCVDENQWLIAAGDAKPGSENAEIDCVPIAFVKSEVYLINRRFKEAPESLTKLFKKIT